MRQALEALERVVEDAVRIAARQIRHETDAARVMFETRVIHRRVLGKRKSSRLGPVFGCGGAPSGDVDRLGTGSFGERRGKSRVHRFVGSAPERTPHLRLRGIPTLRELTNHTNRNLQSARKRRASVIEGEFFAGRVTDNS